MAVNVFPSATGGDTSRWVRLSATANQVSRIQQAYPIGLYKFSIFSPTFAATPSLTVSFLSGSTVTATGTSVDSDTGSTVNAGEVFIYLGTASDQVQLSSSTASTVVKVEPLSLAAYQTAAVTQYTTTQTIVLANEAEVLIIGAGGNGGGSAGNAGGGGGGSGRIATMTLSAGSYSLIVGATPGGSTSINGVTALGGANGSGASAGTGGSNGGGGSGNGNVAGSAGGANGTPGTGVTKPAWTPTSTGGSGSGSSNNAAVGGGGAGTFYGGGGGGGYGAGNGGGAGAAAVAGNGGGGGGGGGIGGGGGAGGSGAAFALVFS